MLYSYLRCTGKVINQCNPVLSGFVRCIYRPSLYPEIIDQIEEATLYMPIYKNQYGGTRLYR